MAAAIAPLSATSSQEPTFIGEVGLKTRSMLKKRAGLPRSEISSSGLTANYSGTDTLEYSVGGYTPTTGQIPPDTPTTITLSPDQTTIQVFDPANASNVWTLTLSEYTPHSNSGSSSTFVGQLLFGAV